MTCWYEKLCALILTRARGHYITIRPGRLGLRGARARAFVSALVSAGCERRGSRKFSKVVCPRYVIEKICSCLKFALL
jgi:hypothetical protein